LSWYEVLALLGVLIASGAFAMTMLNLKRLPKPGSTGSANEAMPSRLCVAIPARDESANIEACIRSVLSGGLEDVRVLIYDDQSSDGTSEIVARMSGEDARIEAVPTHPMPLGWCGKQHACWRLGQFALGADGSSDNDWILFIDADVRIESGGLLKTMNHARGIDADNTLGLLSTFPRQETRSIGEAMLVTSIFFVLLSYLPLGRMRNTLDPAASAACGQFMLVKHRCYEAFGGHEALKDSMHDGVKMPRLARKSGFRTDLFDGAEIASCRMYDGFTEAWKGFAKNAYEGLGSPVLLLILTLLHAVGHIAPPVILLFAAIDGAISGDPSWFAIAASATAVLIGIVQRLIIARRQRHTAAVAPLHALSVLVMTLVQWWSWHLDRSGQRTWRGRTLESAQA